MMTTKIIQRIVRQSSVRLSLAVAAALILTGRGSGRVAVLAQGGGCASPPNAVVVENCLTGDNDWDLTGGTDSTIQGFASGFSVNVGQTVNFKINTDAINYRIDIYRLGYYGNAGARKITTTTMLLEQPQVQPPCATDSTTGLVDCGTWGVSATWDTTGQTSGVFLAKLTRIDGGIPATAASHIVFVVRDDSRHAKLLFQTADTTWQAYNSYGGASLYSGGPVSNPPVYGGGGRATKVSYNRPFNTRIGAPQSWLFNAEYPMLRWLEMNGYDVSYFSGVDADRSGAEITNHKVFMSVGHDEYWSGAQRANVEAARDAGVHLAFFSGNEALWKTRWESSIDGQGTPYRTLVSYKETLAGAKIDPNPAWTGLWRDNSTPPADGGRPENGLTGTLWTVNCCSYAITVPQEMGALRFWRNTGIGALPPGTVVSLSANTLGYEWDEDVNNGVRPTGLARLSSTTVDVAEKFGSSGYSIGLGTATHSLTLYRKDTPDGMGGFKKALVFGAGTVQWSWGLDGVHDRGASTPDARIQQATINLFADMGVQPGSIQSGMIAGSPSSDTDAPISTIVSPTGGSIESGGHLTISGTASDTGGGVVAGVEVSVDGGVTWHGANGRASWSYDWSPGAPGSATIMSRATDDSGNVGTPSTSVLVTITASLCPCNHLWNPATAAPSMPDSFDSSQIEVGVRFFSEIDGFITAVRFYKSATNTGTHTGSLWSVGGSLLATGTFTNETASGWQELRFNNPVPIAANTTYVASYHTNVGHYSADNAYFANSAVNSPPLHAPMSGNPGNGVFKYGSSAFPTTSFHAVNYWVDVTFAQSVADDTPPSISQVKVNAIDGSTAVVSWKTNEEADSRVDYSTDQTFPTGQTFSVASSAFVLDHSLTISGLVPNNTYYFRITSIDHASNPSLFLTPSFTVPGPTLHDTASVDFLAGTPGTAYVAQNADGEVILAPARGAEFYGTTLPADWISVLWQPEVGGSVSVANGVLAVDGARVGTCDGTPPNCEVGVYGVGHSLEFLTTFTGDPFQHAGLATDALSTPFALFSTKDGGRLYTRTHNGGLSMETDLGTGYLGSPHRFRIDWVPGGLNYSIDGVPVASHAAPIGTLMRPIAASDFNPVGGNIVVNWIRLTPYATTGSFTSRVFDAQSAVDWQTITWQAFTPAGTSVAIYERTGDIATPDGTWTDFTLVTTPGEYTRHPHARFVQYRADLATSDPMVTPELQDIIISTAHAPVAVNDTALTNLNTSKVFSSSPLNSGSLMFNDTDADTPKAQLRVAAVSAPLHGTATLNTNGTVTYTPQTGYSGPDTFTYTISDGLLISNAATVTMGVGNVPPIANDDGSSGSPAYTVNEDGVLTVPALDRVTANDSDPNGDSVTAQLVTDATHGHVVLSGDGSFTYTPNPDTNGPDHFTYQDVDPFGAVSNVATVYIGVTPVNDAPSFVKGANQSALEDSGAHSVAGWATAISAGPGETQNVTFIVGNDNTALFSVQPAVAANGTLTFTPAANATGSATVTVQAHDDGGTANGGVDTSAGQTFTITIIGVNDAPSFTKGADQTALEDSGAHSVTGWATAISAGPGETQAVDFIVSNDNNPLFSAQPAVAANGTLTFTPAANRSGTATVTVQVHDDGGTANGGVDTSAAQTFTITITGVNDAPSFTKGADQTVLEDSGAQSVGGWATAISAGPYESQNVDFIVTNDNNGLFSAQPAVAANGTLTFTPALNANGSATVTVRAHDDGGTANGGIDTSAAQTFTISVTPVNDAPSFTKGADQTALEDSGAHSVAGWATAISAGPGETQNVTFIVGNDNNGLFSVQPAVAANGALTYTSALNATGSATVTVQAHDDGGTANGGVDTSAGQTFTITITGVNDAPSFTKGADQTVLEDSGAQSVSGWATAISAGPGETQTVNFIVSNDNNALFSVQPAVAANGTLTFTPALNVNGSATVTVQIHDDGGTANGGVDTSAAQTFTIGVTAVNDAPSFTKGANQSAAKNSGAHSVAGWATNMSVGPANESSQALTAFNVGNNNAALFSAAPAIALNGTLTYTSAAGAIGVATVTVTLSDNGGTANGGVNTSAPQTFTITIFDPPPVAQCQPVTVQATLIGTAAASIDNGSFDPDGGGVTLAQNPPGPYAPGTTSVTLNVTDTASQTTSCSANVTVTPFAPGASFGFEEASGTTVIDSSGNGNNGTFSATNGPTRVTGGRFGKAMQFDGVDDLITVADSNSLDLTTAATMMAWVKVNTQTGWRNILMKQNGSNLAYSMYANNSASASGQPNGYVMAGGTVRSVAALDTALTGKWMHVAVTYGGGSLKIYLNGVLHRTLAVTGNIPVTSGPLWLGGNQVWLDEFFSGVMDEVRIMGVTLSETDIRTLMRTPVVPGTAAPATSATGLVASYNFDDGTATDKTGLGHNGALGGAVSAQGIYGNALSFNGTSNYVTINDANDLDFTTGMTLEAWVRPATVTGWQSLILKQGPQGLVYAMYGSDAATHGVGLVRISGVDRDVRASDPLPVNTWSHVVVTYDKAEGVLRIYVNGIPIDDRSITGDIMTSADSVFLGGNQFWGEYFNGRMDNVRLYNRALNIVEIQTNQATAVQ